jgi:hypothetical protein
MAEQPKNKKQARKPASQKPAPKAPAKPGRELSEEELKRVAGGELESAYKKP